MWVGAPPGGRFVAHVAMIVGFTITFVPRILVKAVHLILGEVMRMVVEMMVARVVRWQGTG